MTRKPIYTAAASVRGGREGHGRSADGMLDVTLRMPREMGGDGGGTNPEQLFAVGYAACFDGAIGVAARRERIEVGEVQIDSRVALVPTAERGFTLGDAPVFTPAACEGTTTLFECDYFGEKVYLTQSGQLYNEAMAMAFGKQVCFGPTFRAEKSKTRRHLIEFWMIEPEVAYASLDDIMVLAEEFVGHLVRHALTRCASEMKILERDTAALERVIPPFPRITYTEAIKLLHEAGELVPWGEDFGAPHETIIANSFDRPVFVHRYPSVAKAFYMRPDPEDDSLSLSADLLAPEGYGEIIGGGERIADLALLERRIAEQQLPAEAFDWYLDLRRYGSVPHAGFGLGIERTVAWVCGLEHIRETIPFPRMLHRLRP